MAVIETLNSMKGVLKLNDGSTATGSIKTVNLSMGKMAKNGWDNQKVMNIAAAMSPLLSKSVYRIVKTAESDLEDE